MVEEGASLKQFDNPIDWQIDRRAHIQFLMSNLLKFLDKYSEFWQTDDDYWHSMNRMVGVSFSLWRSAFLTNVDGERLNIFGDTKEFLKKVIEHNAISFADDHRMSEITFVYYINNARYRLERMAHHDKSKNLLQFPEMQQVFSYKSEAAGDIEKVKQEKLWDDLYLALLACFKHFKGRWFDEMRPADKVADGRSLAQAASI